jgi:hypothetical protein
VVCRWRSGEAEEFGSLADIPELLGVYVEGVGEHNAGVLVSMFAEEVVYEPVEDSCSPGRRSGFAGKVTYEREVDSGRTLEPSDREPKAFA